MAPYAITGKGIAITSYEPRGSMQDAIDLAVVPVGELHAGRGIPKRYVIDSLTICAFLRNHVQQVSGLTRLPERCSTAACGWDVGHEEW